MNAPGITRHYGAGPRHAFCYSYADPASVGPRQPLQLQFWIPKGRKGGSWKLAATCHPDHGKTWRKVFPGHSHADKLAHSIAKVSAGYARDRKAQCELYTAWAVSAGLRSVAVFAGDKYSKDAAKIARLEGREVDAAEFIGDAPTPEIDLGE